MPGPKKRNKKEKNLCLDVSTVQRFPVFRDSVDVYLFQFMKKKNNNVFMVECIPIELVDFGRQYFCVKY